MLIQHTQSSLFCPLICYPNFILSISNPSNIIKKKQQKHVIRSLKKNPIFDVKTHKVHYFSLQFYGFDGEIKNVLIRYIHFVNGRIINHIKLLRIDKSKPQYFLIINRIIKFNTLFVIFFSPSQLCPLLYQFGALFSFISSADLVEKKEKD